ncbi:uncharacterized protein LOC127719906 [Mytilus californianus]|uniref:uncharacterized protein LOC127719906 n=1 Tax=Mytilus californianus TaxID=6549 RepID=UPI0022470A6F|nr:uncharacterized protein LOC127719906 [Mytilus californianus]XP_052082224.1 uncharacterized protein LOC127719906 [Mytilus californianus]
MADKVNRQQRAVSKTTVNTSNTRATSKTTEKSVLTTSSQQNGAPRKPILKNGGEKKDQKKENDHEPQRELENPSHTNQNKFDEVLKLNKNKLQVLEKNEFFDKLRDINLEIEVKEDLVMMRGKVQQSIDEARYQIDKQCKQVVTRLDNIGNIRSKFLRKPEVAEYVNFILLHERVMCSWEVNDKVFDLLVFAPSQDVAVEGSKVIKDCIQTIEIENEQFEFTELKQFLQDNNKVSAVPRKKKGDTVLVMTNDQFVRYQRIFSSSPGPEDGTVQILNVPLPGWKLEYFQKFSDLKLKALCHLYKVDHNFLDNHIELHGKDPSIVKTDVERMANELFISLDHTFGNTQHLTKAVQEKCVQLGKQKHCIISIDNKARLHSGWLGNHRDAMMHIMTMVGPVETSECDVLICPVTTNLEPFGCGKDIFRKGGKAVDADIAKLLKNSEETGTAIEPEEIIVIQNTGNLKCQMLLLTVIPPWARKRDVTLSLLYNCARRIINIIAHTGYRSLGIPLDIADDFPSHMYASILINNFWKLRKKFGHFVHLYGYADTLSTVEDIDDFLISEIIILGHMSRIVFDKHPPLLTEKQPSSITVNIVEGSIVDVDDKVDVVVNATNHKDLEYGVVSRQLIHKAGRDIIVPEYLQAYPDGIGVCDVAVTEPGRLKCQKIFHGCLFGWIMNGSLSVKMLKLFITRCLAEAEKRQFTSIAFPALGSSLLVFPPVLVAKVMFKAVETFGEIEKPVHLKSVDFVLNPIEKEVIEIFENVQDWMVSRKNQLTSFNLPPKHIRSIHKKHGMRFIVARTDDYKDMRYKEVMINIVFVSKENQVEVGKFEWDMVKGSYTVKIKIVRTEKSLIEGLKKMSEMIELRRFHVVDIFLLNSRESVIIKDSRPSSFGPWTDEKNTKPSSSMSLHKQIDLVMTTILKNTDKIYEENSKSDLTGKLSYIRVVRMFATTVDFKEMMKNLKNGGIEGGHGETSSWHLYEKKPEVYKYHIQAIGRKDDAEMVLDILKKDVANMEVPKKVVYKIAPPVKKVKRKIESLHNNGYHITLDEAGKKAILEGTEKDAKEIRKELEDFIDNTLNINLSEDDFTALMHLGKKESWFKQIVSHTYDKGTLVLTMKKGLDPEPLLKKIKTKIEEIRKMAEIDVPLQKKMTLFLEEIEKEVQDSVGGIACYIAFNKKRIVIKAPNMRKAHEAKYLVQVKIGVVIPVKKKKKKNGNQSKETTTMTEQQELKNGTKFTTKEGINILVYPGELQNLKADCLVSPANRNLQHTKGIALNIAQAAGTQMEKECEEYLMEKGDLIIGTCCSTTAGNLPYHCIIHTVGPTWHAYGDEKKNCLEDLKAAIVCSLHHANEHKHKSIAFTSVGTGIYGIPKPFCAIQYYKGVEEYGKNMNADENTVKDVHFIDSDESMCQILQKTFSKYLGEGKHI